MADELDSLIISASVLDDFSDTLEELSQMFARIDAQEEKTFPAEADMRIAEFMVKAKKVKQELRDIDRMDPEADVDIDQDPLQERVASIAARGQRGVDFAIMGGDDDGTPFGFRTDADPFGRLDRRQRLSMQLLDRERGPLDMLSEGVADAIRGADIPGGSPERSPGRKLISEFLELRLFMSGLMNTMAALVPLFAVFVGALPAAIAGLGALAAAAIAAAGALAAPIGLGIGGMVFAGGQLNVAELQDEIRQTLDTFLESFTPVMEALQPMVEGLFEQFRFLIRDLSRRSNVLLQLTDDIAGGFEYLSETIGPALEDFILFGQAALPTMQLLIGGLASFDWFKIFSSILRQTLPLLDVLATQLVSIAPAVFQMSMGFFAVADAILLVFGVIAKVIDAVPVLGESIGAFVAILFTAISVTALYSVVLNSVLLRLITLALQGFGSIIPSIHAYIAGTLGATAATLSLLAAAGALFALLTFGLGPVISGIFNEFIGLGNGVANATDELKRFERQATRTSGPEFGGGPPGYGRGQPGYGTTGGNTTVVAPDQETGNAIAANMRWGSSWSPASPESDIENSKHSE